MMRTITICDRYICDTKSQKNNFAPKAENIGMESRLIVKNFGPIKDVNIELRNVNVFIGPQASGKSALAKIYTIFKAPRKFFNKTNLDSYHTEKVFRDVLEEYNINSFLQANTEIVFESELHTMSYIDGSVTYIPKLSKKINSIELLATDFDTNRETLISRIHELSSNFIVFSIRASSLLSNDRPSMFIEKETLKNDLNKDNCREILDVIRGIEEDLSTNTALYIPAERNFINIIKKSSLNLILNNVPIPKHILSFGAELEKVDIKEMGLQFIQKDLVYKNVNGEDRIYTNENHSIKLSEAASGIQSVVPILVAVTQRRGALNHRSFVIEEPELNLFPTAQYELLQRLESSRMEVYWEDYGTIHTYTTHSPYVLSGINNLLYAHKVKAKLNERDITPAMNFMEIDSKNDALVKKILIANINPVHFTAYQINNGYAQPIFDREKGLIMDNYIDESSDKIADDFQSLMELLNDNS